MDGGDTEDVVATTRVSAYRLALDFDAGVMYWTDLALGKIRRASLDGSIIEDLVVTLNFPVGIGLERV